MEVYDLYVNAVISKIKITGCDPSDEQSVIAALSKCVCSTKLIKHYRENKDRVLTMKYTYDS